MSRTAVSAIFHPLAMTLSILFVAGAAFGAGSAAPKGDGIDNLELAELVAKESFKEFGRSAEGTVLARFHDRDNPEPLGVWVYQGGALREAGIEKLDQALGADRGLWPPYILLFATFPEGKNKLRLEVSLRYDMGLLPDTRGGTSSTWQLERRKGRWVLIDEAVTMHYD
jgi:hypothetical protein